VLPLSRPALMNSTVVLAMAIPCGNALVTLTVVTTSGEEREYGDAAARLLADMWVPKTKLAGELLHALRRMAP